MSERFYVNVNLGLGQVEIAGQEAHHLATVCRLRPGDSLTLFNGRGEEYPARVLEVGKRRVLTEVLEVSSPQRELGFRLEVAAPLPKGDRANFLVEKLTELGASAFVPLQTARSVVQPRDAKLERLQRHVVEASKQCGRNVLMQVRPLTVWHEYCQSSDLLAVRLVAHPGGVPMAKHPPGDVVAAIGPEGGFTDEEIALAIGNGWSAVDLGPRILRVETAALALAALLAIH